MSNLRKKCRYAKFFKNIYDHVIFSIRLDEDMVTDKINIQRILSRTDIISAKLFWRDDILIDVGIDGHFLHNVRFTDDVVLFSKNTNDLQIMSIELNPTSKQVCLHVNVSKNKVMSHDNGQLLVDNLLF